MSSFIEIASFSRLVHYMPRCEKCDISTRMAFCVPHRFFITSCGTRGASPFSFFAGEGQYMMKKNKAPRREKSKTPAEKAGAEGHICVLSLYGVKSRSASLGSGAAPRDSGR
jgi:hypothetical protein